ncbi:MAG: ABC transporter ATP-binding protein [Spirochaetales bacterium]|nr:ABC transporter ATP-binding protein [Spirochaetales bacterium]
MVRRFLKYYKPHLFLFILDLAAAVGSSFLAILIPYLTRDLLRTYIPQQNFDMILIVLGIILGIYCVKTYLTYVRVKWGHILGLRMEYDMRDDLFQHIQKLSFSYFDNVKTGHIMSRISSDLNMIAEIAHHAPEDLLISALVLIGSFIFMFTFNVYLSLIALIPLPFMLVWGWVYGLKMRHNFRQVRKTIADINSTVENSVQGIREVKSYANEKLEMSKFSQSNTNFKNALQAAYSRMAVFFSGMNFLRDFYYLVIITGGIILIYYTLLDVTELVTFILFVSIILPPIDRLINFIEQYQQGVASFERFLEIMDIEPDITDAKHAGKLSGVKGEIKFDHVSFRYKTSPGVILDDVSFTIKPGEKIAIVGESGAGKSTIVSLLPRFYEPQQGVITIDGKNVLDIKQHSLRQAIGLVQQNVFLFDSTVQENIMYGNPSATFEEMVEAAKMSHIFDYIDSLPDKFDTLVGERGIKLSGGQKQRISIARVFLKNPPILIFDEATSSLDSESESYVQDAMAKLSQNRTTIIIAHRLSTVKSVDRIYVLREGKIIEEGTHEKLIGLEGYYHTLYEKNLL